MNSKKIQEIENLKEMINEMREWDCQKVADLLCDELAELEGDYVL